MSSPWYFLPCDPASSAPAGGSSIPNLASLRLRRDAGGIADLNPGATRARPIGAVDPLRHDALGPKLACMGEAAGAIFGKSRSPKGATTTAAMVPMAVPVSAIHTSEKGHPVGSAIALPSEIPTQFTTQLEKIRQCGTERGIATELQKSPI
jgi:hypothetical protein